MTPTWLMNAWLESVIGSGKMMSVLARSRELGIQPIQAVRWGYMDIQSWGVIGQPYHNTVLNALLRQSDFLSRGITGRARWYGSMADTMFDYRVLWQRGFRGLARAPVFHGCGA